MTKKTIKQIIKIATLPLPLLLLYYISSQKSLIISDVERWMQIRGSNGPFIWKFLVLCQNKVFRNIFYHRTKKDSLFVEATMRILALFYKPESSLKIFTKDIGPGLFIQHGISTIISAKSIGNNCWINQQVTIGYTNDTDTPTIGNNVQIGCGAIVLGDINVGDFAKIGAGAVVIKDVPPKCTVVGVPGRIIKKNG